MKKYLIDPQENTYQVISGIDAGIVSAMKNKGMNIFVTTGVLPNGLNEDENLLNRLSEKLQLIYLSESIQNEIANLPKDIKGIVLYKTPNGNLQLRGTDIVDKALEQSFDKVNEVLSLFLITENNIVESIAAHIVLLQKKK